MTLRKDSIVRQHVNGSHRLAIITQENNSFGNEIFVVTFHLILTLKTRHSIANNKYLLQFACTDDRLRPIVFLSCPTKHPTKNWYDLSLDLI